MYVYLTAHMREGISARPGVTGGVTGSGGTSNTHVTVHRFDITDTVNAT